DVALATASVAVRIVRRGRAAAALADRADIAEQLLEQAAMAAQGRRAVVAGVDIGDQLEPGAVDALDIAAGVEADVEHDLLRRARHVEGELAGVARDVIPVALVELADEG